MVIGFNSAKATGFASPAQGYEEKTIDLNAILIKNPPATFFFNQASSDMVELGIPKNSTLIVDRSRKPQVKQFALLQHEGRFFCRQMVKHNQQTVFTNGITEIYPIADETEIIGTVTACIQVFDNDFSY